MPTAYNDHPDEHAVDAPADQAPAAAWPAPGAPPLWEQAAQHAAEHDGDPGPHLPAHNRPTLGIGVASDDVLELARLLAKCGYATNSIAAGQNYTKTLDNSVMTDVRRFCADHGVTNDPNEWIGKEQPPQVFQDTMVGPYIWEALYRVAGEH